VSTTRSSGSSWTQRSASRSASTVCRSRAAARARGVLHARVRPQAGIAGRAPRNPQPGNRWLDLT